MALGGTNRGTGSHNTSVNTWGLNSSGNFATGSWAVLAVGIDNPSGGGAAQSTYTAFDSIGNTWTRRLSNLYDPGAANAGIEGAFFTTAQSVGAITTSTTIYLRVGNATTAKVWTLTEVTKDALASINFVKSGTNVGSANTTPTVTSSPIGVGNMIVGALFNEQGTVQIVTQDGDTTNGTWSSQQTTSVGITAAGQCISTQHKVVTAGATQTYNPVLTTSSDVILGWMELEECSLVDIIGPGVIPVER